MHIYIYIYMLHVFPITVNSAMISNDDMFVFFQGCPFIFTFAFGGTGIEWIYALTCQREAHINLVMTTAIETYVDHRTWKVMQPDPIEWYDMICNMMIWERDFPDTWIFKLHTHLFFLVSTCIRYVLLLLQLFEEHVPRIPVSVWWPVRKHWLCRWLLVQCCTPRPLSRLPFV